LDSSDVLLSVQDLHTYYGDSYVLQGISLQVPRGRVVAVLGRNGMGKTTLIRSLFGLTPARQGDIRFMGQSLIGLAPYEVAERGISLVPQGRRIFRHLTVRENLLLPVSGLARGRKAPTDHGRHAWTFDKVLEEFPQLRDRLANGGSELSGGEQQMLAIGRALMSNPELVLMDEPSEGLSPRYVLHVADILRRMRSLGHAILLVEQNLSMALSVADQVLIISSGRLVFNGTPAALQAQPEVLNEHLGVSAGKSMHAGVPAP
jgi:branched-chain amino acid transport system ATP-binding protein